ncbi:MAG: AI-2E family transporter [Bacteroidota bacterium]
MEKNFPHLFFLVLVLLVSAAFVGLVGEFLMGIFWAIILTILFHNMYDRLTVRLRGRHNLAATLTLLFILLIVILPVLFIGSSLVSESIYYYEKVESGEIDLQGTVEEIRTNLPVSLERFKKYGFDLERAKEGLNTLLTNGSQIAASQALKLTQNFFSFFLQFSIMLYVLFFFLRDGKQLIEGIIWVLPIGDEKERALIQRFESVARATVKGSLLVAILQGVIGGILFWAVGIPAAMLWGVVMIFLSLLPIGSTIVWLPAAIILIFQGAVGKGIAVLVVGSLVIGLADNILRPRLVGQDTKMPDYLILIATLGGISWFGISGFVIGPIIAALFITVWQMMGKEFGQ